MKFFIEVDKETDYVLSWSSASYLEDEVEMDLPREHPFFEKYGRYRFKGNLLFEDGGKFVDAAKAEKADELGQECQAAIFAGFDHEVAGETYHFSYDAEAQANFQTTQNLFFQELVEDVKWTAKKEGEYVLLTIEKEDFKSLFVAAYRHKEKQIVKLREELLPGLQKLDSIEAVDEVKWG